MACRSLMCIFFSTAAIAMLVGGAVAIAPFDAAAGHPHGEPVVVVVAAVVALRGRRAAEFAAPDDQRVLEHAALLQVGEQARRSACRWRGRWWSAWPCRLLCWSQPPMPSSMNRTPASAKRRASRHCRPKLIGPLVADAVGVARRFGFVRNVHDRRHGPFHAEGQLVRFDHPFELG